MGSLRGPGIRAAVANKLMDQIVLLSKACAISEKEKVFFTKEQDVYITISGMSIGKILLFLRINSDTEYRCT